MLEEKDEYKDLEKFWYWLNKDKSILEIRIMDNYKLAQTISKELKVPYSECGLYIDDYDKLLYIVKRARDTDTINIGLNKKQKCFIKKYDKYILQYTGKDIGIRAISCFSIDIDRKIKGDKKEDGTIEKRPATIEEKEKLMNVILKIEPDFEKSGINNYCIVDSANGYQIIIPLDEDILIPSSQVYKNGDYIESDNLIKYRKLIKVAIGNAIKKKYLDICNKNNAEIDDSNWVIGHSIPCPCTFNHKYNSKKERKIIKLVQNGNNEGLADLLFKKIDMCDVPINNKENFSIQIRKEFKCTNQTLRNSELVKFLLSQRLPDGGRNAYLIVALKGLINDCNIDVNDIEVRKLMSEINSKQQDNYTLNAIDKIHFYPSTVNSYCIIHNLPLVYPDVSPNKPKVRELNFRYEDYLAYQEFVEPMDLPKSSIVEDINYLKELIFFKSRAKEEIDNMFFYSIIKGVEKKYQMGKYFFDNILKNYFEK